MINRFPMRQGLLILGVLTLTACAITVPPSNVKANARLTPSTSFTRALTQLPEPRIKIPVAVYTLRDQTGQFKSSPDSPYSTNVTQGAATLLVDALRESGWYIPVEREGLQNLLTERRIVRAIESPTDKGKPVINLPTLLPASLIIEGGITGYDSNVRTGGKGANFLGIGANTQYRVDQVTVGLRSVDIRTGQVLNSVSVTKTVYSYQFDANIYKFVSYQRLLQGESGYTTNEPAQLAVKEAIEASVVHLTIQGVRDRILEIKNEQDWYNPVIQTYLKEYDTNLKDYDLARDEPIHRRPMASVRSSQVVRPLQIVSGEPIPSIPPSSAERAASVPKPEHLSAPAPVAPMPPSNGEGAAPAPTPDQTSAPAPAATTSPSSPPAAASAGKQEAGSSVIKNSSGTDDIFKMYWQNK